MKCPRCKNAMAEGTKAIFGDVFGCTRRNPEKLEALQLDRIQPYFCTKCGYIEFYKETKQEKNRT
jgi:predicted nucleic-acid-binding Zn-ribbon protein